MILAAPPPEVADSFRKLYHLRQADLEANDVTLHSTCCNDGFGMVWYQGVFDEAGRLVEATAMLGCWFTLKPKAR